MRSSWIITFAAICGISAFVYTLATAKVRPRRVQPASNVPPITTSMAASNMPRDIQSLEDRIANARRTGGRMVGIAHFNLARAYADAGRMDDARGAWEDAARLGRIAVENPQFAGDPDRHFEIGWSLWKLGRFEEGMPSLFEAEQLYMSIDQNVRTAPQWHRLGWTRKLLGQDQDAVIAWSRARGLLEDNTPGWNSGMLYDLACYQALAGDKEAALATINKAAQAGWADVARAIHDEDLESLHGEARFTDAVGRMGRNPGGVSFGPG